MEPFLAKDLNIHYGLKPSLEHIESQFLPNRSLDIAPCLLEITRNYIDKWKMYEELFEGVK